jgi:hypothetical protein
MKRALILFTLFCSTIALYGQGKCELYLEDGRLSGSCKNSYFTNFEILVEDEVLDSTALFNQLPLSGTLTIDDKYRIEVGYELTYRAGFPQILFKASPGWFTMDSLIILRNSLSFHINHDPDVPVTDTDLKIIRKAKDMLKDEKSWNKNDDRDCRDDIGNNNFSLFCALKSASIEVVGDYNHRNAIMQKIRHTIVEMYPNKEWEHRLQDFNNMPETNFNVLKDLLNRVENEVIIELNSKE